MWKLAATLNFVAADQEPTPLPTPAPTPYFPPTPAPPGCWEHVGPWNFFDDVEENGESGTLDCAASPAKSPHVIYTGGQNNGVSSGVLKTTDGGKHWLRKSKGLWDTRILGVWVHPDDALGDRVFAGTHTGIYESTDGAESWRRCEETLSWGNVMSFREGVIQGERYILANSGSRILTRALNASCGWNAIDAPGGLPANQHLSVNLHDGNTEVLTCIGGWGGGDMYYASLDSPTSATWTGPVTTNPVHYDSWELRSGTSEIWGKCKTPTDCDADVHPLGAFPDLETCQRAVNATTDVTVVSYTYQHNVSSLAEYAGMCYVISSSSFYPHPQGNVDSGRAPGTFPGEKLDCSNVAIDPTDRNHFLFSKGGEYRAYESKDGGKSIRKFENHDVGAFFVMIDSQGWFYTATQAGAFVSSNAGASWDPYHVVMHRRNGGVMDRVPHDYQRIVPDFRGTEVAIPSDQGLHIVNRSSFNLMNANGDLRNAMALSAIIAPSTTYPGSRNLVVNLWDWDIGMSHDDGATWAGWSDGEISPGWCGEGGGGQGLGTSGKLVLFHRNHWASSVDGGHNWIRGNTPGAPGGSFVYERAAGSRSEPSGTCFTLMDAPPPSANSQESARAEELQGDEHHWVPFLDEGNEKDDDDAEVANGNVKYMLTSEDFGQNYTWKPLPAEHQFGGLAVDPTTPNSLFGFTGNCISHSTDKGLTWSPCSNGTGLTGTFHQLIVKDPEVMFMLRNGAVPLRTTDGGSTWQELSTCAPLFKYGATLDGSLSWSGNTLVLHGTDHSAINRGEYGTSVSKSHDDGESWIDETGDLVTISPGSGVWYENDFYFVTSGEGVTVKRDFEVDHRVRFV